MIGADGYRRLLSSIRIDLLNILGKSYIIEHIKEEIRKHQEKQLFYNYVADSIGHLAGSDVSYSSEAGYLFPLFENKETRTAEEITNDNAKALAELCGGGGEDGS